MSHHCSSSIAETLRKASGLLGPLSGATCPLRSSWAGHCPIWGSHWSHGETHVVSLSAMLPEGSAAIGTALLGPGGLASSLLCVLEDRSLGLSWAGWPRLMLHMYLRVLPCLAHCRRRWEPCTLHTVRFCSLSGTYRQVHSHLLRAVFLLFPHRPVHFCLVGGRGGWTTGEGIHLSS